MHWIRYRVQHMISIANWFHLGGSLKKALDAGRGGFHSMPEAIKTGIPLAIGVSYLLLGSLRFVPIENDSMRIALGIQSNILYRTQDYSYFYDGQAGTYKLSEAMGLTLGLRPFDAFSLLTIVAALVFLIAGTYFIKRISNASFLISCASLILFQEVWVSAYYPNPTIIAASFISIALLLATWAEYFPAIILASVFFSLAVWMRFDAIALGGAFFILLGGFEMRRVKSLCLFAITFVPVYGIVASISDVSLATVFGSYLSYGERFRDIKATLNNYSTIFTLVILYFEGVGLYRLLRHREWRLILLSYLAPLPLLFAYDFALDSPKKIVYALVLFSIPMAYSLKTVVPLLNKRAINLTVGIGLVLFTAQYIATPPYEILLSRATIISTADQQRLRGAIGFTPLYWVREKSQMSIVDGQYRVRLDDYIVKNANAHIITHDWMANQWVMYHLQTLNYRVVEEDTIAQFPENGQRLILRSNNRSVWLLRWQPEGTLKLPDQWEEEIREASSLLYIGPDVAYAGPQEPSLRFSESFIPNEFSCKLWEGSPRFWTMECWR